jgi:hypothetical protein
MPAETKKFEQNATVQVVLPRTDNKKLEERKLLFAKMKSLVEKDKELLPTKKITCKRNMMFLTADDFGAVISFDKPISLYIRVEKDLEKNKNRIKELANKLINYLNILLGESAKGATISSTLVVPTREGIDLPKKIVEETKLAKINEIAKKRLHPKGITFEYTSNEHENLVMYHYDKKVTLTVVMSSLEYKDLIPWDFTEEEYKNLKESIDIIGRLAQKEF